MNNKFDLAFFKNIPMDVVEYEYINEEEGYKKFLQFIELVKENQEKFENGIIDSCDGAIDYDYTFGDSQTDDEYFKDDIGKYLLKPMSREEYQSFTLNCKKNVYDACKKKNTDVIDKEDFYNFYTKPMREILDFNRLFGDTTVKVVVVGKEELSIEFTNNNIFNDSYCVIFDYDLNVIDVLF